MKDNFTKREVLSIIAKLFDPAGWLGPIIVLAKMLMQEIWSEKTDWDEFLWTSYSIDSINKITISRWIGFKPSAILEVHSFCDAYMFVFNMKMVPYNSICC